MQVYRGMDIGTAKPDVRERSRVRHHMIDVVDPEDEFTAAEFQAQARQVLDRDIVIAGGSGLHFRAVVDPLSFAPSDPRVRAEIDGLPAGLRVEELRGIDPKVDRVVDLANPRRVARALEIYRITGETPTSRFRTPEAEAVRAYQSRFPFTAVGLDPGPALSARVRRRLDAMARHGLVDEVESLAPRLGRTASQAVGYKQLLPVVRGETSLGEGLEDAWRATLRLAKHQRTYFHRDPRIRWVPWDDDPDALYRHVCSVIEEADG